MWNLFFNISFLREILTFLLKFSRTISIKYNLQSNISILSSLAYGFFNIVTSEMVTDLNNTGKRKRIYTKHKSTTSENDNILLSEKGTQNKMRRYSDSDSPYLPPKYTRIQHFNHQKGYTQIIILILIHRTMTP